MVRRNWQPVLLVSVLEVSDKIVFYMTTTRFYHLLFNFFAKIKEFAIGLGGLFQLNLLKIVHFPENWKHENSKIS